MKTIPPTTLEGVVIILKGYNPALTAEKLVNFLGSLSENPVLVSELMKLTGRSKTGIKDLLKQAGVKSIGLGGRTGKENSYDRSEAYKALGLYE